MRPSRNINAGDLRQRVTWQTLSGSPSDGSAGQDIVTPTIQGTYYCQLGPVDGFEVWNAQQLKSIRPYKIVMRKVGAIKAGDQLVYLGRVLTVTSVFLNPVYQYLEILATEQAQGVAGGP